MRDLAHGKNVWRSCRHKKRYCTYNYAVEMAIRMTAKFGKTQYVYWCPFCHGYHLTTLRQKDEREARILENKITEALKKNKNGTTNPIRTEKQE